MKKVLIVTPTLSSGGGVIRGLQNMLALFPTGSYHIDVLPLGFSSGNNVVLTNCKILPDNFFLTAITAVFSQTEGYRYRRCLKAAKGVLTLLGKIQQRIKIENKLFCRVAKKYKGYDVVIAYQEGPCTRFVQYVDSPYRIGWIHCDYAEYKRSYPHSEEYIYEKYQRVVCVSKFTLQSFQTIYPRLKARSLFIYNLLDKEFICNSAADNNVYSSKGDKIRLLSIGRLHPVKQFHLIPSIIAQMQSMGATDFKWLLIGGGTDSDEYYKLMAEVERLNISEDFFSYLGPKYNPYPYIANSDILVSLSLSEACPFVVNEARVLDVPVVSNNYPSISEFIQDDVTGKIVPIESMAKILVDLVTCPDRLDRLKEGMLKDKYDNEGIIKQICNLLDGYL